MRVEKSSSTVYTPLDDGTGVLLNVETLSYYSLNRSGVAIWEEIDRVSSLTLDDLVRRMCDGFEVDQGAAQPEIEAFLGQLEQFKMVRCLV